MKRALSESDTISCTVPRHLPQKRPRVSLPQTKVTYIDTTWTRVMGWLRALPAEATPPPPTLEYGTSRISPPEHAIAIVESRSLNRRSRGPGSSNSSPTRRERKARARSTSPTKRPESYRNIYLSEASVRIHDIFEAPAEPELPQLPPEIQAAVGDIAEKYCDKCRAKVRRGKGEEDWRAELSITVVESLLSLEALADILESTGSDRPWRPELKPVRATQLEYARLTAAKLRTTLMLPPHQLSPDPVKKPHQLSSSEGNLSLPRTADNLIIPLFDGPSAGNSIDPSASETLSAPSEYTESDMTLTTTDDPDSLSTPKPDVTVGIRHDWFPNHQKWLVNYLKTDPTQGNIGLHVPFLIFETKANASLFSAQNQAAVGAACMLRILYSIGYTDAIVWSVTTEGPTHELWLHQQIQETYHSIHIRTWRMTKMEDATAFVETIAKVMLWGSTGHVQRVVKFLDMRLENI